MQGTSKGKQPMQFPTDFPVQTSSVHERAQELPPKQLVLLNPESKQVEQPVQADTKGKQPEQSRSQQLVQGNLTGKRPEQLPFEQSVQANPDAVRPDPKQLGKHPAQQGEQSNSKGKQPMRKTVFGNPQFFIARIPIERAAPIERVKVDMRPDTARPNPQTFFFKHIPDVDRYWGIRNFRTASATRIVRLASDGKTTPYFLLVNRGEYPKVKSARNVNAIIADMHEPIFGDAFVFKLGDPELYENGYARYVHIEKDIGRIDWLPGAIREAATKVKNAAAPNANPGFLDLENYADPETMKKNALQMLEYLNAYKKIAKKDALTKEQDYKAANHLMEKMARLIYDWRKNVNFQPTDGDPGASGSESAQGSVQKALAAFKAIKDDADDVSDLRKKYVSGSPDVKTTDTSEKADNSFQAMRDAFSEFLRKIRDANRTMRGASDIGAVSDAFWAWEAEVDKQEALIKVEVAKMAEAARISDAIPEMPDRPGHPGTLHDRIKGLTLGCMKG